MKTRKVEMYYGVGGPPGGQWRTLTVEIPADTPEADVEHAAIGAVWNALWRMGATGADVGSVAFVGVYHVPDQPEYEAA